MARNMITGIETQKMQEYTQEQIDRAEHMGIAIPADVKEQIFEYANLVGEEEKVRTLVRNLADAVNRSDEDRVEELLDDAQKTTNLLNVMRHGFMDRGIKFYPIFWKPETSLNETTQMQYDANILHCTRQQYCSIYVKGGC